jgi:HPt (histidine-containing phosphotransfer) domain-containing protein
MSDAPVDRATYDALAQSTGADFARELAGTFLADAPTMLAALRAAFERADAVAFRRTAHSLKSNAQTFGAFALGARARALETTGLDAIRAAGGAPLDDLESEYARVAAALGELARG